MNKLTTYLIAAVAAGAVAAASPRANQQAKPPAPTMPAATISAEEAAALAQYWVLLAEGRGAEAGALVGQLLSRYPRNVSILALVIEAEIARGGATAALTVYEQWLAGRPVEEPGVVRRVARAMLYEWTRQVSDGNARGEALDALARDGDANALAVMYAMAQADTESGLRMGVHLKNPTAIGRVIDRMRTTRGSKIRDIEMLARTKSPLVVPVLAEVLKDEQPENRMFAAEALGSLGGPAAEQALKPLLDDSHGLVRTYAAGALFKIGNYAGINILNEVAASDIAAVRRTAAKFMESRPDDQWKSLVRGLLSDPDPSIRLDAARMLVVHDPAAAQPVLNQLAIDDSIAIREETELVLAQLPTTSLVGLRAIMRAGRPLARVRAASRVLEMTR